MASPSAIVGYLRDCYEADNRETSIANLFHDKVEHLTFLEGEDELLRGGGPVAIDVGRALEMQKRANMYRVRKSLVYCAFPIVGNPGKASQLPQALCAPLIFYPAAIVEVAGQLRLKAELAEQQINFPVLQALLRNGDTDVDPRDLLSLLPAPPFKPDEVQDIVEAMLDVFPQVSAKGLSRFPRLLPHAKVKTESRNEENNGDLRCLSACAVALIPNSPQTSGVLFELAGMEDAGILSRPLATLLCREPWQSDEVSNTARVPAVLSAAQQSILTSAAAAPLTLAVGPPGTGKSYTIAAAALDHVSRGESVIIASQSDHAVDVVAKKIFALLGPNHCVLRGGRRQYMKELKQFLQHILQGAIQPVQPQELKTLAARLKKLDATLASMEGDFRKQIDREQQWGEESTRRHGGLPERLFRRMKMHYLDLRIRTASSNWELLRAYEDHLRQRSETVAELLRTSIRAEILGTLLTHRSDLNRFLKALRARTDWNQEKLFSEIKLSVLLKTFPIWMVTLSYVSEIIPMEREMFDLAIIDEATQCNMAACLPVLQRAKRILITGDPNQLRHVSFLSRARQKTAADAAGLSESEREILDYRDRSLLDLVNETIPSQEHVIFLDEHYRSMPNIIRFSNREFYANSLRIMTRRPETVGLPSVQFKFVSGVRGASGTNPIEAEAIVEMLADRVERELDLQGPLCQSFGVLSPFRAQVDLLARKLEKRLSNTVIEKHDLRVGTAHSFQGEERDVMLISLAVDKDSHPTTFRFLDNPNVFNVAITRARSEQYVFSSVQPEDVEPGSLLRRYLEDVAEHEEQPGSAKQRSDEFLSDVSTELGMRGYTLWPAYPVAGMQIDLLAERNGTAIGIDLIGYPGEHAGAFDLERYRMFNRAGLSILPLSYSAWCNKRDECLSTVEDWLKMGL